MQRHVSAAPDLEGYVWFFGSLHPAFEMSWDIEYLEKQLLIFLETWSSSFCIVCNCFDDFRTNLPKNFWRFHRKENTNFSKRRRVRSKIVFLSSAGVFRLVVTKKSVLRTSSDLYLKQYVFFVQMQSHVSAAPVLEGYVWYFGSSHPAFEMSCDIEYF